VLPFLPIHVAMVCARALVLQPSFLKTRKTHTTFYSINVSYVITILRVLFPQHRQFFAPVEIPQQEDQMEDEVTLIEHPLPTATLGDTFSGFLDDGDENVSVNSLRASVERTHITINIPEFPISASGSGAHLQRFDEIDTDDEETTADSRTDTTLSDTLNSSSNSEQTENGNQTVNNTNPSGDTDKTDL